MGEGSKWRTNGGEGIMANRNELQIGTRVYHVKEKWVGNIVMLDEFPDLPELVDVRWRTPEPYDEPSCLTSSVDINNLIVVNETIKSPYKDYTWHEEAKRFFAVILLAVDELELSNEINEIEEE